MFTSVRVLRLSNANLTNQGLNKIFTDLCENLLKVRNHHGAGFTLALFFGGFFFLSWTCYGCLCLVLGFTSLQFIMFVSEFLLQAALYDPLLSLSSQLHRSSARRRAHTGETIQAITHLSSCQSSECNWEKKFYLLLFLCSSPCAGHSDSRCHDLWQGTDSGEDSWEARQQRSVSLLILLQLKLCSDEGKLSRPV